MISSFNLNFCKTNIFGFLHYNNFWISEIKFIKCLRHFLNLSYSRSLSWFTGLLVEPSFRILSRHYYLWILLHSSSYFDHHRHHIVISIIIILWSSLLSYFDAHYHHILMIIFIILSLIQTGSILFQRHLYHPCCHLLRHLESPQVDQPWWWCLFVKTFSISHIFPIAHFSKISFEISAGIAHSSSWMSRLNQD